MRFLNVIITIILLTFSVESYSEVTNIVSSDFESDIKTAGYNKKTVNNMSDSSRIKIKEEPNLAYINITGVNEMPTEKGTDSQAWFECYDGTDIYFKKRILLDAQGNTSLRYFPKTNFSVDFFNDEWIGEDIPNVNIGKWIKQNGFHFKAYYNDFFRGGCAQLGYRLFADMIADLPRYQERAGLEEWSKKALCFPEGFPCLVYLNGKFYGVFSWQLKKHRDNMDQKKKTPEHIHLDGKISNNTLFHDNIDWTFFEVRNPKGLFTMDGSEYDGDSPSELMDETSSFFDPTDEKHVRTATTKKYISKLSHYNSELEELEKKSSNAEMRKAIAERFDVIGMLDYSILALISANYDAFEKNWQWFTYDGIKWFVAPYDLDSTFGNQFHGYYTMDAFYSCYIADYKMENITSRGPSYWIFKYYFEDIKKRYALLRDNRILSIEHIMDYVYNWQNRVGEYNYNREYKKWSESYCNRDLILDNNWTTAEWKDYDCEKLPTFDWNKTYQTGDVVWYYYRVWKANNSTKGKRPFSQIGYHDDVSRVLFWISQRLQLEDEYLSYKPNSEMHYLLNIQSSKTATICVPFDFQTPSGIELFTITGIQNNNVLLLDPVGNKATANKPYLVIGEPGTYELSGKVKTDKNRKNGYLIGVEETMYAPKGSYVLQQVDEETANFRLVENDNEIAVASHKAYLEIPQTSNAPQNLIIPTTGEINTSIEQLLTNDQDNTFYSIYGNKQTTPPQGLSIINQTNGKRSIIWIK